MLKRTAWVAMTLSPGMARAHSGDHGHLSTQEFLTHVLGWEHIGFLAVAAIAGWIGVRQWRNRPSGRN